MLDEGSLMHGWAMFLSHYSSYYANANCSIRWNEPPNDILYKCELPDYVNVCQGGPYFDKDGYGLSHFAANIQVFPVRIVEAAKISENASIGTWMNQLKSNSQLIKLGDITDGASNTIMVGTVGGHFKPWGHPVNVRDPALGINRSPDGFGGPAHWHGAMFSMCDGSVRFFSENTDPKIMQALGTPAGGEVISREFEIKELR
jgi:hypothetical protein